MLKDKPLPSLWLDDAVLTTVAEYTQCRERETYKFECSWQAVVIPKDFIQIFRACSMSVDRFLVDLGFLHVFVVETLGGKGEGGFVGSESMKPVEAPLA
jgi:hypothetical protein